MSYYNTTNEEGKQVKLFNEKNETQDEVVIGIFQIQKRMLSPSDVWKLYPLVDVPLTSIRRTISDLTKEGLLIKTPHKKDGIYGRPEYFWQLLGE